MKKLVLFTLFIALGVTSSQFLFSGTCTAAPAECPDKECSVVYPAGGSCMEDADPSVAMVFAYDANGDIVATDVIRCPYTHCM